MSLQIRPFIFTLFFAILITANFSAANAQGQFTFEDVMQFKSIDNPVLSPNGDWIAFGVWPERGDGEARIKQTEGSAEFVIERGERPQISSNSQWVAPLLSPRSWNWKMQIITDRKIISPF